MRVAESVLFAGKAIRVLRNPSTSFRFHDAASHQQMQRGPQKIQGFVGRFPFLKEPLVDSKLSGEELFPQSEADKIETLLRDLKVCTAHILCCQDSRTALDSMFSYCLNTTVVSKLPLHLLLLGLMFIGVI